MIQESQDPPSPESSTTSLNQHHSIDIMSDQSLNVVSIESHELLELSEESKLFKSQNEEIDLCITDQDTVIEQSELEKKLKELEEERESKEAKLQLLESAIKRNVNSDSLEVTMSQTESQTTKTFYFNYVKDGTILNAEKTIRLMKKDMLKTPGSKLGYLKCACHNCKKIGIDTFGRSNALLEHMRHEQGIKIQCVYCDKLYSSWQRARGHVRMYHWNAGKAILLDKENLSETA